MQRWSTQPLNPMQPQRLEPIRPDQRPIGRLPLSVWLGVIKQATLPDIRSLCLTCRSLASLAKVDAVWDFKLALLDFPPDLLRPDTTADNTRASPKKQSQITDQHKRASRAPQNAPLIDDFGEFETAPLADDNDLLKFDSGSAGHDLSQPEASPIVSQRSQREKSQQAKVASATTGLAGFKQIYNRLLPFYTSLQTHTTSSLLFTHAGLSSLDRALLIRSLKHLLLQPCAPSRSTARHTLFKRNLTSAQDFFESTLFADFERASKQRPNPDEVVMARCGHLAWQLGRSSAQSLFDVFLNQREIFYESSHNPHWNIVKEGTVSALDFSAMETYMNYVVETVKSDGSLAARVFPKQMNAVKDYAERVAQDAVSALSATKLRLVTDLQPIRFPNTSVHCSPPPNPSTTPCSSKPLLQPLLSSCDCRLRSWPLSQSHPG